MYRALNTSLDDGHLSPPPSSFSLLAVGWLAREAGRRFDKLACAKNPPQSPLRRGGYELSLLFFFLLTVHKELVKEENRSLKTPIYVSLRGGGGSYIF